MPDRRQLIQKVTVPVRNQDITFSSIPQNFTDLLLVISSRDRDSVGNYQSFEIRPNGSTTNLSSKNMHGVANTVYSESIATAVRTYHPNGNATAGVFGAIKIFIPNYRAAVNKVFLTTVATENFASSALVGSGVGVWASTDAITSLTLKPSYMFAYDGPVVSLYGIARSPIINGGQVIDRNGYRIHTFSSTQSMQVVEPGEVEYLVVAGGGGGGSGANSGGGGAGGMRTGQVALNSGVYTVTVGAGGAQGSADGVRGVTGSDSTLSVVTSTGGGGGGSTGSGAESVGRSGGSGGGGGLYGIAGGTGISGQGNNGGTSQSGLGGWYSGGGGGGAGAVGGSGGTAAAPTAGTGGAGLASSIGGYEKYYAGGGGGGANYGSVMAGGIGGGGAGGFMNVSTRSFPGFSNTGGGGGGGASSNTAGSAGGSGIVIIRYPYDGN